VFDGKMIVYIQTNDLASETISVRFTAPWLKAATIKITR